MVTKLEETGKRTCRRGVSLINDPFLDDSKGQPSKSSRVAVIFSSRQLSSLSLGGLLGVPICINKKASSLSRLALS